MIKYNDKTKNIEGKVKSLDGERWIPIKWDRGDLNSQDLKEIMKTLQVAVYIACGGGMLGDFGTRQPRDFYIDLRVGRLPYPKRNIRNLVECLIAVADWLNLKGDCYNLLPRIETRFLGALTS